MDSNFNRKSAFANSSYQRVAYLKRKREHDDVDAQQSSKQTVHSTEPSPKKVSVNNRLQQFRNVIQTVPDSKNLRLHQITTQTSEFTSIRNAPFKDSNKFPISTLETRLNNIRNNQTNNNVQPSNSGNRLNRYPKAEAEEHVFLSKPLKNHLPNTSVDYKRKCMEYLQSSTTLARAPVEISLTSTPVASGASNLSSCSDLSFNEQHMSPLRSDMVQNNHFQKGCDNAFSSVNNYYTPEEKTNCYGEVPIKKRSSNDEDMFMDWAPFDEKSVLSNIQEVRATMLPNILPHTEFQKDLQNTSSELARNNSVLKTVFIVIDTNIFLSHLEIVKEIMEIKINGIEVPIMFLPWIVIQELDYIKDGKNAHEFLKRRAQIAIKFINACLQSDKKILQGQNISDVMKNMTPNTNADDAVLNCCLQILERKNRAILLSNDINLRNKALINNVPAYGHDEIVTILDPFRKPANEKGSKIDEIKTNLSHLVSMIIVKEMKVSYGTIWNKMGGMSKPPWSLEECLERLLKYWTSVFSFSLQNNAKENFQEFKKFLIKENSNITKHKETFVNYCFSLCNYLRNGFSSYRESIDDCVKNIIKIQKSL